MGKFGTLLLARAIQNAEIHGQTTAVVGQCHPDFASTGVELTSTADQKSKNCGYHHRIHDSVLILANVV